MDAIAGDRCVDLVLVCFGVFSLVGGILVRLGTVKYWFSTKPVPALVVPKVVFGMIPFGLASLVLGLDLMFSANPDVAGDVFCFAVSPLVGLSLVFIVWQPRWLKPAWYRWLEDNYGEIMPLLRKDAQSYGRMKWQRMVRTQRGLEEWAERVYHRYKQNPTPIYG